MHRMHLLVSPDVVVDRLTLLQFRSPPVTLVLRRGAKLPTGIDEDHIRTASPIAVTVVDLFI
jgi:hypothetical protein